MEQTTNTITLDEACREIARLRGLLEQREAAASPSPESGPSESGAGDTDGIPRELYLLYNTLLLTHTPNMIFLFNEDLEYVIGSSACRVLTRQERVNLARRPLPLLFCKEVDGVWVEKVTRLNQQVLKTREAISFNDTIAIEGEGTIEARITISPMIDEAGNRRGTIMAIGDVTELVEARRRAEDAAKSKSSFLANMSHEIRTPMNAIKGLSELLALTPLSDAQRNYVKNIISSSKSLMNIINDVLDFSKIEANRIEIVPEAYEMHKLLSDLCGSIGLRAEEKGLTMFLEVDPELPARLIGDDNRIKQIVLNLLSNAVKYTTKGHIALRVGFEAMGDRKSVMLKFTVEDTGIGVREGDVPLLFNAFSRVDLKTNRAIQGTGLGLAISKQLASAMNGDIRLHSVYGLGSTFGFFVPQKVADPLPLACIDEAQTTRVLLVGTGPQMENAGRTLRSLGVASARFRDVDSDEELAEKLGGEGVQLPVCGEEEGYTHCLYSESIPDEAIGRLREILPGCRFALMRSLINDMNREAAEDAMLFNPLMVTELAKFLNRSGQASSKRIIQSDTAIARRLKVRDAVALVVDDNRINLMVCEKMLSVYGVKVFTASGGVEALGLCGEREFDIIFLDHMMPEMDGMEVAKRVRSQPGLNMRSPIVALTANVANDMRTHFLMCGMDDFVPKPIDRKDLSRVLHRWLPPEKIVTGATL